MEQIPWAHSTSIHTLEIGPLNFSNSKGSSLCDTINLNSSIVNCIPRKTHLKIKSVVLEIE